jgi:dihydroorotase
MYAEAFEQRNALDKLEGFASLHGPDFYGLPATPTPSPWSAKNGPPRQPAVRRQTVIPLRAGEKLRWRLLEENA